MKLTEYLAIYAAFLSTFIFVWNIFQARSRVRLRIVVGVDNAVIGVYVFIQNTSLHAVHLAGLTMLYPLVNTSLWGKVNHLLKYRQYPTNVGWVHTSLSYYGVADGFPLTLEARSSHKLFISDLVLKQLLQQSLRPAVRAKVQDALWRNTYSQTFVVDWHHNREGNT